MVPGDRPCPRADWTTLRTSACFRGPGELRTHGGLPAPMNTDTKAIIGTIVAATISLGGLLSVQFASVNTRIDDVNVRIDDVNVRIDDVNVRIDDLRTELIDRIDTLRADLSAEIDTARADLSADNAEIRNDLRRMDDRLRAVEIAFGKVDQRLETLERLHRPDTGSGE